MKQIYRIMKGIYEEYTQAVGLQGYEWLISFVKLLISLNSKDFFIIINIGGR